ncbi:Fic family protein [Paracoccus liaowanqingii]|uniref:helix-turn-helix domain-containing protein n=1 Tax=Paracoccus liaowanqingii TaxID=2560053 RepID=UPI001E5C78C5|nr:helix-turn-helix domain-containing protein [Paracoccus liaowanqingii]
MANSQPWLAAQSAQASALADAARDLGRLEATLLALPAAEAAGARERLVHLEVEAMLRAQGLMLGRDEIGRELMEARAASDPEALRLARWAVRRLEGQGPLADLPAFLGLHRRAASDGPSATSMDLRLQGREFDGAAVEFLAAVDAFAALHPLARGPAALALWRMAELSPPGQVTEPAVWSARHMAAGAEGLRFVPFGRHGRRVWTGYGPPVDRLATHLAALRAGAQEARALIQRIGAWSEQARVATTGIKGDNAARVIAVLAARPFVSAMEMETRAGISRPTAERMLKRLNDLGLTREVTGNRRFRLWTVEN